MFYVYILHGSNGRFYVGYTGNIERRLVEHRRGNTKSTKGMGKKILVGFFEKTSKKDAIILEKQVKRSGHISRYIEHTDFLKNNMGY